MYDALKVFVRWWDQMQVELDRPKTAQDWAQTAWLACARTEDLTIRLLRRQLEECPTRTLAEAFAQIDQETVKTWNEMVAERTEHNIVW